MRVRAALLALALAASYVSAAAEACTTWKKVVPIPRVSAKNLTAAEFFDKYSDLPVVLTDVVTDDETAWWKNLGNFASMCAGTSMPTSVTSDNSDEWAQLSVFDGEGVDEDGKMPVDAFAKEVASSEYTLKDRLPIYGFDYSLPVECPALFQKFSLPAAFSDCMLQRHAQTNGVTSFGWPSLMVGEAGSRSELHIDNSGLPFWMSLLKGRKRFLVLPPVDNLHLTGETPYEWNPPPTGEEKFRGRVLDEYFQGLAYKFKAFGPPDALADEAVMDPADFTTFPNLCEATIHETILGPGEMIYIPNSAPHGALNLETTAAITANFFSPYDRSQQKWLEKTCSPDAYGGHGALLPPDVCEAIQSNIKTLKKDPRACDSAESMKHGAAPPTHYYDLWDTERDSELPLSPSWTPAFAKAASRVRLWLARSTVQEKTKGDIARIPQLFANLPKPYILYEDMNARNGNHDGFAHTEPPRGVFDDQASQDHLLRVTHALLRRGMMRLYRDFKTLMRRGRDGGDGQPLPLWMLPHALLNMRSALDSYENFLHQFASKMRFGPSQLIGGEGGVSLEYGPETSFWLGFRPYLSCSSNARLGPEVGGPKSWCNHRALEGANTPRYLLSVGSGDDFTYEDWALAYFENADAAAKVATLDCFSGAETSKQSFGHLAADKRRRESLVFYQLCSHGSDPRDLATIPTDMRSKCVALYDFLKERKGTPDAALSKATFPHFDAIKMNIEAFEYPSWFDIMARDDAAIDATLGGTHHIHLEQHRLGMQRYGLSWESLLFGELLFACFYSAGYHPFSTEKWHDDTAAQDVAFVNQTWWLHSELAALADATEGIFPDNPPKAAAKAAQLRTPSTETVWREKAEEVFAPASLCKSEFCELVRQNYRATQGASDDAAWRQKLPVHQAIEDGFECAIRNALESAVDLWWMPPGDYAKGGGEPVQVEAALQPAAFHNGPSGTHTHHGHRFVATAPGAACTQDVCEKLATFVATAETCSAGMAALQPQ